MRRLLFALIILFCCSEICAQTFKPLVKEGASWIIREDAFLSTFPIVNQYYFQGDTTLMGKDYKKLYSTMVDSPLNASFGRLQALMRQDSLGRVFAVYSNPNYFWGCHQADTLEEFLYYDFGMLPGDTMYVPNANQNNDSVYYTLDRIDTLMISGVPRRVWIMKRELPFGEDIWIEGIGSIHGLYFTYCEQFEVSWILTCYFDNEIYYRSDTTRSCKYLSIQEIENNDFLLYPNPTSGRLTIDLGRNQANTVIDVFDNLGQLLQKWEVKNTALLEINLPGPTGIYMISLTAGNERRTFKVMKQ